MQINHRFWIEGEGKKLGEMGMEAQIVGLYLLTNPHANRLGLYYCPIPFIVHETGLSEKKVRNGLEAARLVGFCEYDEGSGFVWVKSCLDLSPEEVQKEFAALPKNPFLERFRTGYKKAPLSHPSDDEMILGKEEKEERAKEPPAKRGRVSKALLEDPLFLRFWEAYPRKVGKGAAANAWKKLGNPAEVLEQILSALEWQTKSPDWTKDGGQYVPHPATYLNQARWLDEPPVQNRNTGFMVAETKESSGSVRMRLADVVANGTK